MTEQTKGTKRPMNTGALKRVFGVLVVLLLAATLMVGAGSAADVATISNETHSDIASYPSLDAAVADAVTFSRNNESDHYTVQLLSSVDGAGIKISAGTTSSANITIDLGGNTYTVVSTPVGSTNTENQALHFERENTIILKDGVIKANNPVDEDGAPTGGNGIAMLLQNYAELTVDNVTVDGTGINEKYYYKQTLRSNTKPYTMSNNNGTVILKNGAKIIAHKNTDGNYNGVAFDVYRFGSYTGVSVTIETDDVIIEGPVEFDGRTSISRTPFELVVPVGYILDVKISGGSEGDFANGFYWNVDADGETMKLTGGNPLGDAKLPAVLNNTLLKTTTDVQLLKSVQLDDPLTISTANLVFNGTGNTLVLNQTAGKTAITVSGNTITLKDLGLVAAPTAEFGTAIKLGGQGDTLIGNFIDLESLKTESATENGRLSSIAVFIADSGSTKAEVKENIIIAGNSASSSSQCIVVSDGKADIEKNILITGAAHTGVIDETTKATSSGSIAVRVSGADAVANVKGNAIFSGEFSQENLENFFGEDVTFSEEELAGLSAVNTDTTRHAAFALDGSRISSSSKIDADKNLILLSTNTKNSDNTVKYSTVVYLNADGSESGVGTVELTNNIVIGSTYVLFVDDAKNVATAGIFTTSGSIINNNFKDIAFGLGNHTGVKAAFADGFKWCLDTPAAITDEGNYVAVVDGQVNAAGNYWAWSEGKSSPSGYMVLTTPGSYGVNDLKPLVAVNTNPTVTIKETENLSIALDDTAGKILTAELAGVENAQFTWSVTGSSVKLYTVANDAITATELSTTAASTVGYKLDSGASEGTVTLKAEYKDNPAINTSVTITIYKVISETASVGTVSAAADQPETGYAVNIQTSSSAVTKILNESGDVVESGTVEEAVMVLGDGTEVRLAFEGTGTVQNGMIAGTVTNMYLESSGAVTAVSTLPITVTYELSTEVSAEESLTDHIARPSITPNLDPAVEAKLNTEFITTLGMLDAAMSQAGALDKFNKNLSGTKITLTFSIDDPTGAIDHTKLKVLHISDTGKVTEAPFKVAAKKTGSKITLTISGTSFSSYVLVQDKTPQNNDGNGGGSSSSGSSTWLPSEPTATETPTEQPTDKPTDTVPTDIPSTQPTATPASPGFGILAALAGLGAVAALRRQ